MTEAKGALLPCPFCGGRAEVHPTFDIYAGEVDGWFAWCGDDACECKPETGQFLTAAEAIEAWNTRAERTCKLDRNDVCNVCGASIERVTHSVYEMGDSFACHPNYCPNCGAKVVGE